MATSGRPGLRIRVRIDADVWREEVERYAPGSAGRLAGEHERASLQREGIAVVALQRCSSHGSRNARLEGLVKSYVPINDRPASERPFGLVFDADRDESGPYLDVVAFGERHPKR